MVFVYHAWNGLDVEEVRGTLETCHIAMYLYLYPARRNTGVNRALFMYQYQYQFLDA